MTDTTTEPEMLRASDEFLGSLVVLQGMEVQKRALAPDDPQRHGLAVDIEELSLSLLGRSQYQTRLAAGAAPENGVAPRQAHLVLADWQDAERRLRDAHLAVRRIGFESTAYQDEYRQSIVRVNRNGA